MRICLFFLQHTHTSRHGQNGAQFPDEPLTTTLTASSMISSSSSLSSAAGASIITARAAISAQSSGANSGISPVFVALICASILGTSVVSLFVWRRLASGEAAQSVSVAAAYNVPMGRTMYKGVPATRPPEMFDVWTERQRCTSDGVSSLKWEEYMVSAVAASPPLI